MKRIIIGALYVLIGVATFAWLWNPVPDVIAQSNEIVLENSNSGTTAWGLSNPADDSNLQIKGYASATSVNRGETMTFFVTTAPAQAFTIEIYRMGWYGGNGGRLMTQVSDLSGTTQNIPPVDPSTGLLELNWSPNHALTIPNSWVSGAYLAKLINANGYDNYIPFVVRDDNRSADILYQQSVTTYQAYNNFPDNGASGKSLYDYNSFGTNTVGGSTRAVKVSFDRPYDRDGSGDFFKWEHDLIMWMERSGYDVVYSTNVDTHERGANLQNYKAFVSTGHDEYWSREMFGAAETARDQGVHLAFMGANAVYWQIRFENAASGAANRVLVSYKDATIDPEPDQAKKTITFLDAGRPEQVLRGVTYADFNPRDYTDLIIQNSGHWLYNNTGLSDGDQILEIVGYEVDTLDSSLPQPHNTSFDMLTSSPFVAKSGATVIANTVLFRAPSGAWVFSSGTMSWSNALQDYWDVDSRIQQATANLFDKMVKSNAPIVTHPGHQESAEGESISLAINASNPSGGSVMYWADELPSGLNINANTGLISGQIYSGQIDTWESSVTVSNGSELTTVFFTWTVNALNAGACRSGEQEAEIGKIYGNFRIGQDSNASNGKHVQVWPGVGSLSFSPTDRIVYCFTIAAAGTYRLKRWV